MRCIELQCVVSVILGHTGFKVSHISISDEHISSTW